MGRSLFVTLVLLSSFLIVGCDDDTSSNNANNANNANNTSNTTNTNNSNHTNNTNNSNNTNNTQERLTVDVLQEGNEERDGVLFDYQLLRLTWGDRDATYAYIALPSTISSTVGMVLSTMPYDVIDWTGESVDEQAALTGTPTTIETLHENSYVHLLHGFGHLAVFGRFYTEHSIRNDVNDMITGLKYLGQHPRVDANRIGIQGGSWGGFEALYAAAYAPRKLFPQREWPSSPCQILPIWLSTSPPSPKELPILQKKTNTQPSSSPIWKESTSQRAAPLVRRAQTTRGSPTPRCSPCSPLLLWCGTKPTTPWSPLSNRPCWLKKPRISSIPSFGTTSHPWTWRPLH